MYVALKITKQFGGLGGLPERREKDRLGCGEGKKKLLRTVVSFLPHKSTFNLAIYIKVKTFGVLGATPLKTPHKKA